MKTFRMQLLGPLYLGFFGHDLNRTGNGTMEGVIALYGRWNGIVFRVWRFALAWKRTNINRYWTLCLPHNIFIQKTEDVMTAINGK